MNPFILLRHRCRTSFLPLLRGTLLVLLLVAGSAGSVPVAPRLETRFHQVHPLPLDPERFERSKGERRAVVLLHGLRLHLQQEKVEKAGFHDWQKAGSKLVLALAKEGDVFAFAYSQNVAVDAVAQAPGLRDGIRRLHEVGYAEVVLVGHSAGGLVARQFVEDHPDAQVTKVIQVCTPNTGCGYAKLDWLSRNQKVFVDSLSKPVRRRCLETRAHRKLPDSVQFVCLVGAAAGVGDIVVSDTSQWSKDLQDQGVPAVRLWTGHFWVTRNRADAQKIADLVGADHPRWDAATVAAMKKKILGG